MKGRVRVPSLAMVGVDGLSGGIMWGDHSKLHHLVTVEIVCQSVRYTACRTRYTDVPMLRDEPRERCDVCGMLEPRKDNGKSAKRAKKRRLDEKEEMDRIKKQSAHLQRHAAGLEARFATLVNVYNNLQQYRNLVLGLGTNPVGNLEHQSP